MDANDYKIEIEKSEKLRRESIFQKLKTGFTFNPSGRCGYIYYKEDNRLLEIYIEMSGVPEYHFLLWEDGLDYWVFPKKEETSIENRKRISDLLLTWLNDSKYKTDYSRQIAEHLYGLRLSRKKLLH